MVGVWLAATAAGIQTINVTALENSDMAYAVNVGFLGDFFKGQLSMSPSDVQVKRDNGNLTLRHTDALIGQNLPPLSSDALMVFMGNAQTNFGSLFDTFTSLGQATGKPFLFAATATNQPGEAQKIENLYVQARQLGGLSDIPGMVGKNAHALRHPHMGSMTHSFVFAGVKR
jgi:hypothetical protein